MDCKNKDFDEVKKKIETKFGFDAVGYTYEEQLDEHGEVVGEYKFLDKVVNEDGTVVPKYLQADFLGENLIDADIDETDISKYLETVTTEDGFVVSKYFRDDDSQVEVLEETETTIEVEEVEDPIVEEVEKPKAKRREYKSLDGHKVRSQAELDIDDILYNALILHAYEKEVTQISSEERVVLSDWFVPVYGDVGIYIEYWGLNSPTYIKNKEAKIKLYLDNDIPLIQIEMDEIKDKTKLTIRLLRELKMHKEKLKEKM